MYLRQLETYTTAVAARAMQERTAWFLAEIVHVLQTPQLAGWGADVIRRGVTSLHQGAQAEVQAGRAREQLAHLELVLAIWEDVGAAQRRQRAHDLALWRAGATPDAVEQAPVAEVGG